MPRFIGDIVRERRESLGLNQTQLAERLDKDQSYVSRFENNEFPNPHRSTLQKMANALETPISYFLQDGMNDALKESFANNALKEIPLLTGTISASTFTHSFTEWEGEMIAVPVKNIKNKVAWKISGHSMDAPDGTGYQDGEVVILDNSVQFLDGDHVVAENDHGVTIKEIKIIKDGSKEGTIELRPLNPDYPTIKLKKSEKFEILGVVIASYRERKRKKR